MKGLAQRKVSQTYDAYSNILTRTGAGKFDYLDANRPDRVTAVDGAAVTYDANGNMRTRGAALSITYTPFDVPRTVTAAGSTTQYKYDASGVRVLRTASDNTTTAYSGSYETKRWNLLPTQEHRYAIQAEGRVVAEIVRTNDALAGAPGPLGFFQKTRFFHGDHLGSPDVITAQNATVEQRLSFEAFGRARRTDWSDGGAPVSPVTPVSGFTGVAGPTDGGLVSMHGRWYDPVIGRFLSPDPITAAPFEPLGQNRYVYAWNRPLTVTDRSGFSPDGSAGDGVEHRDVVVPDRSTFEWGWDVASDFMHGVGRSASDSLGFSFNQVVDAVQREDGLADKVGAGGEAAMREILAKTSQAVEMANKLQAGALDSVSFGLTKPIREAVVPGATDYDSSAYSVGYWSAFAASMAVPLANIARAAAAARAAQNARIAAATAKTTSQTGKAAGAGAEGAGTALPATPASRVKAPEHGTFHVDPKGNVVPTPPGGSVTGSPDGRFLQARDAAGNPTGVRIDGAHKPASHPDPRAQAPHGHVPGVTNADGTPWLPIHQ